MGQFEMSLNPWLSSKLTRYALADHFRSGSTSAVGTFHNPVSPRNVVVAGRVSVELVEAAGFAGAAGGCDVCAAAGTAAASAKTPTARACLICVHLIHINGRATLDQSQRRTGVRRRSVCA